MRHRPSARRLYRFGRLTFRHSNCQPSAVERFRSRSRQHSSGTGCPAMLLKLACRTILVTYVLGVDGLIACVSLARTLTAVKIHGWLRVIASHTIREDSQTYRPRAVISWQRLSLWNSRQRPRKLHGYRQREAAVRYKKNGSRITTRPSDRTGTDDDRPGPRTTLTGEDAEAAGSERRDVRHDVAVRLNEDAAQPVRRHRRWAVGVATEPTRRQPSHRRREGSTPLCLLCCVCCSALGDCFSSLCSSPFCVNSF